VNLRRFYQASAAALVVMILVGAWGLLQVGPDATVPVHWNANGDADGYGSAVLAFALTPLIGLGVIALLAVIPRIEPRRANLLRSGSAYRTVAIALVVEVTVVQVAVVLAGVGSPLPMGTLIGGTIGVLFVVLGNVLGTVRSNFLFGVRTPWTLTSDLAWDRTHRLVGRMFVIAGGAMALFALTGQTQLVMGVMVVFVVVILVTATVYSYRVWLNDPDRRPIGGDS
jgi:uncharacterized membrane protein